MKSVLKTHFRYHDRVKRALINFIVESAGNEINGRVDCEVMSFVII